MKSLWPRIAQMGTGAEQRPRVADVLLVPLVIVALLVVIGWTWLSERMGVRHG